MITSGTVLVYEQTYYISDFMYVDWFDYSRLELLPNAVNLVIL